MKPISIDNLNKWTRDHFYRTSYESMNSCRQIGTKNSAIPGYRGHIPYVKSENLFGRPFTSITRDAFDIKAHPKKWITSTKIAFKHPKCEVPPTFRRTEAESKKPRYKNSGFNQNNSTGDQKGLSTHPIIHGDNKVTEYRAQFLKKGKKQA